MDQNPHWETDWMADREKAFSDDKHKQIQLEIERHKEHEVAPPVAPPPSKPKKSKKSKKNKKKSKKRKNRSSASESSSDSENSESNESEHDLSRSIRVAMRNKAKSGDENPKKSWPIAPPQQQYMKPNENEGHNQSDNLLMSLRERLKNKQEEEMKNLNVSNISTSAVKKVIVKLFFTFSNHNFSM